MKGYAVKEYFFNPQVEKPIEEIYRDMDRFTYEFYPDEPKGYIEVESWILLPPLHYAGKFVKGLLVSTSIDLILQRFPEIPQLFLTAASPRWSGHPWSRMADFVMTSYDNPHRNEWFYKEYPDRQHQQLIPLEQEVDYLDEYWTSPPSAYVERDIDVLCVSRLHDQKNVPLVAKAASIYKKKYNKPNFKLALVVGKDFGDSLSGLDQHEQDQLHQVYKALDGCHDIIQIFPKRNYNKELFDLYSHSKVNTVASLLEGKCRSQREAQFCNTPTVCFKALNQYALGPDKMYLETSGLYAPEFNAESLADTWHQVIQNQGDFKPRETALKHYGRKNYFNNFLSRIQYYHDNIPGFSNELPFDNVWLDVAMQANYQSSLYDYTYGKRYDISHARAMDGHINRLGHYFDLFGIPFKSKQYSFCPNSPLELGV